MAAEFAGRFELHHANYADAREFVAESSCDGVLLDLGVSSPQLDTAELSRLGALAGSSQMQTHARLANTHSPELHSHDRYGHRNDPLILV